MSKHYTPQEPKAQSSGHYVRCYETHKPLPIGEFLIYGGSCSRPMVNNADVYVGFDLSMTMTPKKWPWEDGECLLYPIPDMGVPRDPEEFKKLIAWLALQLTANRLVHIGCIGGHGRTGTVMAALVTHMTGELDSITYVRKSYCTKAVESATQVDFLNKHFGITKVSGAKEYTGAHAANSWAVASGAGRQVPSTLDLPVNHLPKKDMVAVPTTYPMCIWGDKITLVKPENVIQ